MPRSDRANPVQEDALVPSDVGSRLVPPRHAVWVGPRIAALLAAWVRRVAVDDRRPYVQQCSPRLVDVVGLTVRHACTGVAESPQADRVAQRYCAD